ncbi:hypothetical protein F4679DRAFT_454503 [Xylaria curta]|nr:hypothetical protein F4679DRAFT_454503 [Xylaria curta]
MKLWRCSFAVTCRRTQKLVLLKRRPRLDMVFGKAQQLSGMKQDMNIVQEMLMYFFVWLFSCLKVTENYERRLNEYDVPTEVFKAIGQAG